MNPCAMRMQVAVPKWQNARKRLNAEASNGAFAIVTIETMVV